MHAVRCIRKSTEKSLTPGQSSMSVALMNKPMKTCRDGEGMDKMGRVLYSEYLKDPEPKWTF